jgi:hypothetical protein
VTVDAQGNVYVVGDSVSTDYPVTPNAAQSANAGGYDIVATELDPTGATLVYSTYLGGGSSDYAYGTAVDAKGATYLGGHTTSPDFPTTPTAEQGSYPGGYDEAVVAKLAPDPVDAGSSDAGSPGDGGPPPGDAGAPDAGPPTGPGNKGCGCGGAPAAAVSSLWLALGMLRLRRRRARP